MLIHEIIVESTPRTLYHGTLKSRVPSIMDHGLIPQVGGFTAQAYDEYIKAGIPLDDLVFAANRQGLGKCISAIIGQMRQQHPQWNRYSGTHDLTVDDFYRHAAILVFRHAEPRFLHRDDVSWNHPAQVEPDDYYHRGAELPDMVFTDQRLRAFLRRNHIRLGDYGIVDHRADRAELIRRRHKTQTALALGEARDWEKIRNPADRWLARFTYENVDKYPDSRIISTLQKRYPAAPGTIYRGLNFYTAEEYQDFISAFHGQSETILPFNGVSSWTRNESSSKQFAITQPTYFLNRQVMMAHDRMSREREWLSGYRGVILSMELPAGVGIDVDASRLGHESEIVVPAGSYTVRIHRTLKRYADQLADRDTTVDQVILGLRREDLRRSSRHSFLDHVLHHHADSISDRARQHLFSLYWPKAGDELFDHTATRSVMFGSEDHEVVNFSYGIAATELFDLYDQGIFRDPRQKQRIQQLALKILKQAMPVIETYLVRAYRCDLTPLSHVAKIAGRDDALVQMLRRTIGKEYQRLQDKGREINRITNGAERSEAMRAHTNALERLLSKMPRG